MRWCNSTRAQSCSPTRSGPVPSRSSCGAAPIVPVSLLASAGLDSLAVRVPSHPLARELLRAVGRPIAAPSANRSGRLSPTRAEHVADELDGRIAAVLDGGACVVGLESTVLDLTGAAPTLLRPGGIAAEHAWKEFSGPLAAPKPGAAPRIARHARRSHYAPALPLRLDATNVGSDEALLATSGRTPLSGARETRNLSRTADLIEAAAGAFSRLCARSRPAGIPSAIVVMSIPDHGLGVAINDRLRRAATKEIRTAKAPRH